MTVMTTAGIGCVHVLCGYIGTACEIGLTMGSCTISERCHASDVERTLQHENGNEAQLFWRLAGNLTPHYGI